MKRLVRNFHDRHSDRIISIAVRREAECCAVTALLKLKQIRGILEEERGDEIKKLFEMRLRCLNDNPPVTVTCGRLSLDREACRNQARIILDSTSQVLRECSVRYGKITDVYAAYLRKSLFNEDGTAVGEIMKPSDVYAELAAGKCVNSGFYDAKLMDLARFYIDNCGTGCHVAECAVKNAKKAMISNKEEFRSMDDVRKFAVNLRVNMQELRRISRGNPNALSRGAVLLSESGPVPEGILSKVFEEVKKVSLEDVRKMLSAKAAMTDMHNGIRQPYDNECLLMHSCGIQELCGDPCVRRSAGSFILRLMLS